MDWSRMSGAAYAAYRVERIGKTTSEEEQDDNEDTIRHGWI